MKKASGFKVTALITAVIMAVSMIFSACSLNEGPHPLEKYKNDPSRMASTIRDGLKSYSSSITITYRAQDGSLDELSALVKDWIELALSETDDPAEGDYIRFQYGGYELNTKCVREGREYVYTAEIIPKYYGYLSWEERVSQKLPAIMESLGFDENTSDEEKIRAIYDYLCENVYYDKVHLKNEHNDVNSTAYGALVLGSATCHGYAAALYRMLRTAGIDARIVSGMAGEEGSTEYHVWNIVKLDGVWYNVDATWDSKEDIYGWFMKSDEEFPGHEREERFRSAEFIKEHPMARESLQ